MISFDRVDTSVYICLDIYMRLKQFSKVFPLLLTAKQHTQIKKIATNSKQSMSQILRNIIEGYLNPIQGQGPKK